MEDQEDRNKSILRELIELSKIDGVNNIEFQFLLTIASQIGVTKEDFKVLFEQYIKFLPPILEVDRIAQFHRLVLLMNVDAETSEKELDYLKTAGIKMGLNSLATEKVLNEMCKYPNKLIPNEKLFEIFQLFHN